VCKSWGKGIQHTAVQRRKRSIKKVLMEETDLELDPEESITGRGSKGHTRVRK
jgi:hypothetical protein